MAKRKQTEQTSKNVRKRTGTLPSGRKYHVEKENMGVAGQMNRARAGSFAEGRVVHRSTLKKTGLGAKRDKSMRAESVTRVVKAGDGEVMSTRTRQGTMTERETMRSSASKGMKHKITARPRKGAKYESG